MICIYKQDNNNYTNNGDAVLIPTVCDLAMTINGAWQLKIEHPYDPEERYKLITEGAIIRIELECIAELETVYQLFRVYQYTKGLHSIEAIAFPVAMESTYDAPINNLVISGKTGAQAMAQLQTFTNKYTLSSDITATGSSSYNNTNINEAIAGGKDNSFIQVWGGEILYDNYKFKVKTRLGDDTAGDHRVMYGRNLTNIEYEKDDSGIITRISPISQDNIRLDGTGYVDSSHIQDYPVAHHKYETAPYTLVDTEATSPSQTAALTRQAVAAVSTQADTLSHSAWTTASGAGYQPEYIKSIKTEITEAVQNMALANVVSTSLYNLMKTTIANAMAWLGDLKQPKWEWMGSDQTGWKYGNATSYAKNMYVKIGKTWSYFGSDGNWQEPKDDSDEWDWHDVKNGTGKKYGNFNKYFAHNEYVYITQSGTIKEYWFNEQGWFEEDESGDSEYYWHGSGTGADPYWFGKDSSTYLKSCWRFIDGTYYFFDSYGYVATQKDSYQWDWVESGDASRAWFGNAINSEYAATYLTSQWEKINGTWYYFDANGIVQSEAVSQTNAIAVFTTGMSGLTTTVDNWKGQLYSLLYSLMRSYCTWRFKQKIDLPAITIRVDMADLSKTEEYKDFADLEKIRLGDSVECIDYEHNISTTNRVIGITYDCILKSNKDITIGEAAATVAQMVGNAQGEAVTGGFDTSALETQLTALRNGKQDKLTAGDNITIVNNVISSTAGSGSAHVYYGSGVPSSSLGSNRDLYLRTAASERVVQNYSEIGGGMVSYEVTALADNVFNFAQVIRGNSNWDHITYPLYGLVEGKQYTISFDFKFTNATFYSNYTNNIYISGISSADIELPTDNDSHSYSFTFTAEETNNLIFSYPKLVDGRTVNSDITNFTISGEFGWDYFSELYGKIEDEWRIYKGDGSGGGSSVIANPQGTPTDTLSTISIDEIIYELEQTEIEANPSGTATADLTKLGIDGTIYEIPVGSEVEANPTDTGSANLTKLKVDGTTYNIQGGGGNVDDVYVNGQSVVDANGIAQVKTHKQVLSSEYQDQNDDIIYFVEDDEELGVYYAPIIYSTEEREVGTWHDGKPLYNKIYDFTSSPISLGSSWINTSISSTNIDKITAVRAFHSDGTVYEEIDADPTRNNHTYVGLKGTGTAYYLLLEYTKISDSPSSAQFNALGVPMVHYTTDEQVIGTWVDGKPLYQKTIMFGTLPNSTEKSVAHNISNVDNIWISEGYVTTGTKQFSLEHATSPLSNAWTSNVDATNVSIETFTNRTNLSAVVVVKYTKTTD